MFLRTAKHVNHGVYRSLGMKPHLFLDKETFGTDKLVANPMHAGSDESNDKDAGNTWIGIIPDRRSTLGKDKAGSPEFIRTAKTISPA